MKISFVKMSGAGNDFVVIDNRNQAITDAPAFARIVCDRRWNVGADGLLLVEESKKASYRMMYYNADGSYGGMCGNGGRCIAAFAVSNGIASNQHAFEALDHIYRASVDGDAVSLSMKDPIDLQLGIVLPVKVLGATIVANYVNTGSPHVVIPTEAIGTNVRLDEIDVPGVGREIRTSERFSPEGTNVNFVEIDRIKSVRIRTYERGVEAETLACGTGAVAAAVISEMLWGIGSPTRIVAKSGIVLQVRFERRKSMISDVSLIGPAIPTFEGTVELSQSA